MAGICGTDLQLLEGYANFRGTPGHEFVGVVEEVTSAGDQAWVGKRVAAEISVGCGRCDWCRGGVKEHCLQRSVVGIRGRAGAFADFVSVPTGNLHELPDAIDDQTAVFVEPTAAACRILEQVPLERGSRVAVLGDGRMGLLTAQVIRTVTPDVTVFGRHEHKLNVARRLGFATHGDQPFDVVVDATGRPEGLQRAIDLVRPRGTIVLKSTIHGESALAPWPIVVNEVTVVGSRCGPFLPAIELLASGAVQVKPLVSRVESLEKYEDAFEAARRELKVLFAIDQ